MAYISLRNDGWFDFGKNLFPENYERRQEVKNAIDTIGNQPDRATLDRKLAELCLSSYFRAAPIIVDNKVYVGVHWPNLFTWEVGEIHD